jgi:L-threonylcarbamoyladenylate synthase
VILLKFVILPFMQNDIIKAIEILKSGGIILYPTDTIWGIGCDATNDDACKKIFDIKKRNQGNSMLILVNSLTMLERHVKFVPDAAYQLIEASNSPLTIIYPEAKNISKHIIAEDGSIGIRLCNSEFCQRLIDRFRKPIVSTSPNFSGEPTPLNFNQISTKLKTQIDYVVEYSQNLNLISQASPIIKINADNSFKILRK